MSVRLEVQAHADAPLEAVWAELVDWEGQRRWIPFTTVDVVGTRRTGLGSRLAALSGFRLGPVPIGLLDRFVVTGWTPPTAGRGGRHAELEVLHLGPYFTGPGVFRLDAGDAGPGTTISCVELFELPGAPVTEAVATVLLPVMRAGFRHSLSQLARVAGSRSGREAAARD